MKIGIIIHSQTGNTLSVAEKLAEKLRAAGHTVNIEKLTSADGTKDPKSTKIEKLPDLSVYEALVLAAPVQAFNVSPMMKAYLPQLPALNGKKVALFVTKGLPFNWTGGNKATSQMKSAVESKGGKVIGSSILVWGGEGDRNDRIAGLAEHIGKLF